MCDNNSSSVSPTHSRQEMRINMKTYLLALLLLFLLVHTSEAPPSGGLAKLLEIPENLWKKIPEKLRKSPLFKALVRKAAKKGAEELWQNWLNKSKNHQNGAPPPAQAPSPDNFNSPSPPPPAYKFNAPAPATYAEEIAFAKQYLSNYGYITYSGDDSLDEETVSAIKEFQQLVNLSNTGNLDDKTLHRMLWLRCAVPDKNLTYDLSATNNVSWPLGTKWFPNNGSTNNNLTYGFVPGNKLQDVVTKVFQDSFQRWSDAIGVLNLTEAAFEVADIRIGFRDFSDTDIGILLEVVGGTVIQLQDGDDNVTFGSMVLDGGKRWALPTYKVGDLSWGHDIVDLETVVMHQIGHLLGLSHSHQADSVMYPYILPSRQRKVELSDDDKGQIQQVYFSGGSGGVTLVGTSWGLLTTSLSLGFGACMVLFY